MLFKKTSFIFILFTAFLFSCNEKENYTSKAKGNSQKESYEKYWKTADTYYLKQMELASSLLDSLLILELDNNQAKDYFKKIRIAFKKAEPYAGALNPETTHRTNGPALPIYKEDSGRTIAPIGLQRIEEIIFEEYDSIKNYNRELQIQKGLFDRLAKDISKRDLNPERFFIATHQQLMRLISLAMSGFDTPISQLSIEESAISLESLLYVYQNSIQSIIKNKDSDLDISFEKNIHEAITFIDKDSDFISFDKFTFIRDYLNPITRNWVAIRKTSDLWDGKTSGAAFNFDAVTFFEINSFDKNFFSKTNNKNPNEAIINLGEKLFFDKNISSTGDMSCATCHLPEKAYTDGLQFSIDNTGNSQTRNTPTLLNSNFQKAFFLDGRSNTLEDQIAGVFTNSKEFNTAIHTFSNIILQDSSYTKEFVDAFGKVPTKNTEVIHAISAYVATLNSFNSKFDQNIRGEVDTFTENEKDGFNLFMGKGLCATCHFMPLTNGTVPPFFTETEKELIGVPKTNKNKVLDNDLGFYSVYKEDLHKGMFKTPTIRNIELTGPYMHNGIYKTLEEVVDFYNIGGGAGLGFDLPEQTLPFDNLDLNEQEKKDLISFLKTLTDNSAGNY